MASMLTGAMPSRRLVARISAARQAAAPSGASGSVRTTTIPGAAGPAGRARQDQRCSRSSDTSLPLVSNRLMCISLPGGQTRRWGHAPSPSGAPARRRFWWGRLRRVRACQRFSEGMRSCSGSFIELQRNRPHRPETHRLTCAHERRDSRRQRDARRVPRELDARGVLPKDNHSRPASEARITGLATLFDLQPGRREPRRASGRAAKAGQRGPGRKGGGGRHLRAWAGAPSGQPLAATSLGDTTQSSHVASSHTASHRVAAACLRSGAPPPAAALGACTRPCLRRRGGRREKGSPRSRPSPARPLFRPAQPARRPSTPAQQAAKAAIQRQALQPCWASRAATRTTAR